MNNILKQFAAWDISLKQSKFTKAALRLALSYVVGIFCVMAVSSVAIFLLFSRTFSSLPSPFPSSEEIEVPHDQFSVYELEEHFISILVIVDLSVLVVAALVSYLFARRTLLPLEILYKQQEQFVGDVAHELRTPLAVLKAGTESILLRDRTGQEYRVFISELEEEVDRLTRLSNELLFLLKNDKKNQKLFTPVDIATITKQQVHNFQSYALLHTVTLDAVGLPAAVVAGVSDDLVRVLQNLIKNAIDYNKSNGTVTVTIARKNKQVWLSIKDTGIGIPVVDQGYIFDRFYKVDTARTQHGAGLGLAIVAGIIKAHQGSYLVESAVGFGTTVTVILPEYTSS